LTEHDIPEFSLTTLQASKECQGCWNFASESKRWLDYVRELPAKLGVDVSFGPTGTVRNVMEVGCGTGGFLLAMSKLGVNGMCIAYENMPFVQTANTRGLIAAHMSTERALPFPSHSFDLVHAHWMMAYLDMELDNIARVMFEWDRIVRPSGYIVQRGFWHGNVTFADFNTHSKWRFVKHLARHLSWNILEWAEGPGVLDFIVQKPTTRSLSSHFAHAEDE
jgi:ubiquinone/menaquinone biosynthesis C-methylase UbiE